MNFLCSTMCAFELLGSETLLLALRQIDPAEPLREGDFAIGTLAWLSPLVLAIESRVACQTKFLAVIWAEG